MKNVNITLTVLIVVVLMVISFTLGTSKGEGNVKDLQNERIEIIVSDRVGNVSQALANREADNEMLREELEQCQNPSKKIID